MRGRLYRHNITAVIIAVIASLVASVYLVGLTTQTASAGVVQATQFESQPWCEDYLIVGVAGSGQEGYGHEVGTAVTHLKEQIAPQKARSIALDYPAAHVLVLAKDLANSTFNTDNWEYFASIDEGQAELVRQLDTAASECPYERWILVGFSQGSLVIHQAAYGIFAKHEKAADFSDRIFGVMLMGNPARTPFSNGAEPRSYFGNATSGFGIARLIPGVYSPAYYPWQLERYTTEVCMEADPVCDHLAWVDSLIGPFGYDVHVNTPEIFIKQAADTIVQVANAPRLARPTSVPTVEAAGPGSVKVSWQPFKEDNTPITGYKVYLSSPEADDITPVIVGQLYAEVGSTMHSTIINGLTGGPTLVARVYATVAFESGQIGISRTQPSQPFTVPAGLPRELTPPPQHNHLTFLERTATSVSFRVTAPLEDGGSPLTGYKVTTADMTVLGYPETETFFEGQWDVLTITGLKPSTTYRFVVDPCNAYGCAQNSEHRIFSTAESYPDAPSAVTVSDVGSTSATFEWIPPASTSLSHYLVTVEAMLVVKTISVEASQQRVIVGELSPSTEYQVTVAAVNGVGAGPSSAPVAFKTTPPPVPLSPDAPAVSLAGPSSVTVSWAPPPNNGTQVTGYEVSWHDGDILQRRQVSSESTQMTVAGLLGDRNYVFRVAALGPGGLSAPSAPSEDTYVPGEMPTTTPAALPDNAGGSSDPGLNFQEKTGDPTKLRIDGLEPNRWYYASRSGSPLGAGWYLSDNSGSITVSTTGTKAGNHRLALQDKTGALVGSKMYRWTPSVLKAQGRS